MSALLPISASELNICAEYGYSSRQFNKVPMVFQSHDYTSCLFLVYRQSELINHRIDEYRNHFTLFTNHKSIIIARTETTLIHTDNDAIITYDNITPTEKIENRFRSKYKNWDVSFDKINYTSKYPSLLGYRMLCSGEWWFYDRGIILNGLTTYECNHKCMSIFIYYEFHIDHRITRPINNNILIEAASMTTLNKNPQSQQPEPTQQQQQPQPPPPAQQPQSQPQTLLESILQNIESAPNQEQTTVNLNRSFNASSLSSEILPYINSISRPTIRQNDSTIVPKVKCRAVIPSLFWLDERYNELKRGNIDYFKPINYKCPIIK